ncbi:MAG: STAS domain-containing protein [Actinomycetia bacterium]|nr:STAS domain-containing protein [Actinomycetes bacterium]
MTRPPEEPARTPARTPRIRAPLSQLEVQVSYRFGAPLIYVEGELDHESAGRLRASIDEELADRPKALLLDFSRLAYMDSGGLSLLFETARRFEDGGRLAIVNPSANVRRLIELTGLSERPGVHLVKDLGEVATILVEQSS